MRDLRKAIHTAGVRFDILKFSFLISTSQVRAHSTADHVSSYGVATPRGNETRYLPACQSFNTLPYMKIKKLADLDAIM